MANQTNPDESTSTEPVTGENVQKVDQTPAEDKVENPPLIGGEPADKKLTNFPEPPEPEASDIAEVTGHELSSFPNSDEPNKSDYLINEADIARHPELLKQGVKEGDGVAYKSLKVFKYPTALKDDYIEEEWPRDVQQGHQGNKITISE